jgi:hypothetical protein
MVGGKAEAVGMLAQVRQPERSWIDDEDAEDPASLGEIADLGPLVVIDADSDELRKPGAGLVEHAEGAVPGVHEIRSGSDDPAKGVRQIELRSDGDDRIKETP